LAYILGIDTGGTYTDGVVIDNLSKQILYKSKALTTHEDLTIGISECLDNLGAMALEKISLVSLSTTLATNAIVEGRGCEVGLIMIGHKPNGTLPTNNVIVIPGGHDINGRPLDDLNLELLRQELHTFKEKVDAVAISGYLSIRNPEHELTVRTLVQELLHLPVVCAHELTTELGLYERTVTAVLNARLLPIIADLIQSVKSVLIEREINVPFMIVKGDGSLISEHVALEKPIETILSGPASSIIGGTYLTPTKNALIIDMGGTTTDIALVEIGVPRLTSEGANVGGWSTRVHSAEIFTYGLGGDSHIQVTQNRKITVGPERVLPISYVATKYPYLKEELSHFMSKTKDFATNYSVDCFLALQRNTTEDITELEKTVLSLLESGPHSFFYLANKSKIDPIIFSYTLNFKRLIKLGLIAQVSVTPTDILHAQGIYTPWDPEVAILATELLARKMGKTINQFLDLASQSIIDQLCLSLIQSVQMYEGNNNNLIDNEHLMYYLNKALHGSEDTLLNCKLELGIPIIGIGAPIHAWLPQAAERLRTPLIIPDHAEVANAVGAAVGKIMVTTQAVIRPEHTGFLVHSSQGCNPFSELEKAIIFAENETRELASLQVTKAGANNYEILLNREESYARMNYSSHQPLFIECKISATAIGYSSWS
jgi:N-methylhydantoinase A/acetone carboxylase, beta subunit